MASLVGQLLKNIYRGLIITSDNNIITSTPKNLTDGLGNASALSLSTNSIVVSGSLSVTSGITGSLFGSASYALSASYAPGGSSPSYKVYTALLTQTGTNPPVATVLENTIGNISFSYVEQGTYQINSSGLFTLNKTMLIMSPFQSGTGFMIQNINFLNNPLNNTDSSLIVISANPSGAFNEKLFNTPIEIRVYN